MATALALGGLACAAEDGSNVRSDGGAGSAGSGAVGASGTAASAGASSGGAASGAGGTSGVAGTGGRAGSGGNDGASGAGSGGTGGSSAGGTGGNSGASGSAGSGGTTAVSCGRPDGMPAVTLTYDALASQLTTAAPSLKAHGLTATFFVTDVRSNPAPWSALLGDGHELASHTFVHPCPKVNTWVAPGDSNEDYDLARMATELDETMQMLETLGQEPPYTFAYPCGETYVGEDHESYIPLIQERFAAARGVSPGGIRPRVNLYNVPATFSTGTGEQLIAVAEEAKTQGTWVVYGFHGIGADSNVIAADAHEALLTYLAEQKSTIYVATFRELVACCAQ